MIPAKIDSMTITTIREKGAESIVDWFEQHKQSFYTLGWCYFRNQKQIEEIFYRSIIKLDKELPRFNRETSFEIWATSIFLHTCRELSDEKSLKVSEDGEHRHDLFKALDQLDKDQREAVVITYVIGISREEAAQLLHVSAEKLKELLFSGIQSLKKEWEYGSSSNGCKEYYKNYIDYFERTLERSKKIDVEMHIYHCQDCREDLGSFQDILLTLTERMKNFHVPSGFMENVKDRLAVKEKQEKQKNNKRQRIGLIFVGIITLLIGIEFFTGFMTNHYYARTEKDEQLRAFIQHGMGKRLNMEAESGGVKIKLKSVIADDIQTLIFYEIEDTVGENQYMIDYYEGVSVEDEYKIMSHTTPPRYFPPDLKSDSNNIEKNVYQGKLSLRPLLNDKDTIKFKIIKLHKLIRDDSEQNILIDYENIENKTGEWNFEISVTKRPSIEYTLDVKTEIEGIPVRFDKLTIAPTTTILHSAFNYELPGKRVQNLDFDNLKVVDKILEADLYGNSFVTNDGTWISFQAHFDPLFGEKPKEITVQFNSVYLVYEEQKSIELDASQTYPQTFEYAGSTISIDKVEVGQPTKIVISNHEIKNRAYDQIQFRVMNEDEYEVNSMGIDYEGVLVDKNWIEYDMKKNPFVYEEIEQPRYFVTVQTIELQSNDDEEIVNPKRLEIYEYSTTKYLDDVVNISLE
ncbi:sigma-70 family RNA polymerase sigma factor [Lederbergia wuyishanensis]|uniref:RNA polymerase sigma factor (Sigma-70 family) n=1 Tax=Lederbergia wuyishanensis TaxID=1347903 RepID=A0ABU0D4L0_9BACI|nr:sigma-70 family RNA polymerase sigma factor [Lederbergia wuyishanensis]MCJ8008081.1 sigma-70 family RNA polymerase sigma factor [Lederbergia wuyishanensis]MDQ0343334.1 RNA polymerase sigma factor (sigma-70 family) [Lederbergia wuyishanensis]